MKVWKWIWMLSLLALCCLCLLQGGMRLPQETRIWVAGTELTDGGSVALGGGSADYDPATQTLTLTDAVLRSGFRGAAIYAGGDLNISLQGQNAAVGDRSGMVVLGDLTVYGGGSLTLEGAYSGAAVRGCLACYDGSELLLSGRKPLRWGRLHTAPLDTVTEEEGRLLVRPPYRVSLLDGVADAAGNPLLGEPYYESFSLRLGESVPVPPDPERSDYWFGGWYADAALTEPFDFQKPREEGVALYAQWIRIVRLELDSWGGSEVPTVETAWGEPAAEPTPPTRKYYRFAGWQEDRSLDEPVNWSAPQTESRLLYAKWEKLADEVQRGIDVARYQGKMDWNAIRESGVGFVFIRAGYRGYGAEGSLNSDDNFEENYAAATAAGLDVGVYLFSQACTEDEAREEAAYVLKLLDGRPLALPVVMDYELASDQNGGLVGRLYEAQLEGEDYARCCLAFCEAIEEAHYTAAVYAGNAMLDSGVGEALEAAGYPVWLAHWTVQTRYGGNYDFWQYSGSGTVRGVQGAVDLDLRYIQTPPQVTGVTQKRGDDLNFVFWDRVPGVRGYIVYRCEAGGGYAEVARRSGADNISFTDYGASAEAGYLVCAYLTVNGLDCRGPFGAPAASP